MSIKGNFAVEQRQACVRATVAYFKNLRASGELDVSRRKAFADVTFSLGISKRKFDEYLEILLAKGFLLEEDDKLLLRRELDDAV